MLSFLSAFGAVGAVSIIKDAVIRLPLAVLFPLDIFLKMRLYWVKKNLTFP